MPRRSASRYRVNDKKMFNLLPLEEKNAIRKEYRYRLMVVALVGLFVTFLVGSVLLVPSYGLSKIKEVSVVKNNALLKEGATARDDGRVVTEELRDTKSILSALKPSDHTVYFHEVLGGIIEQRPSGVLLQGILMQSVGVAQTEFHLSGVARNRVDLVLFQKRLEGEKRFTKVDIPFSNFAKDSDIPFTVTIQAEMP